ncbi:MAG: response regulator [Desulfatiglans sp.]|jgi:DNA-binding NtrC family response regulator|nr:response regulator [Thermodesulfobacteriota bacterium]MEE4351432.1 response regulator [Desulfatiglans sp.]
MNHKTEKSSSLFFNTSILFVDDDEVTRVLAQKYLSNWNVQLAASAQEALELLNKGNYQIVIVDIMMPDMDGIELLKNIRKTRPLIQVIISTASDDVENLISALEAGACDFLIKPLNRENMEEALKRTIEKLDRWKTKMKALMKKRRSTAGE